ncbi:MAG TPA: class I SAM-dependent methyltransferase [Bryobacterales bacterium]|nr:class I SAM-dependent methyltransferase [Bryobacterales bacterium]
MRIGPLEAHRLWAPSYDAEANPLLALEQRTLTAALGDLRGKRLLDAGCGTGRWMMEARARGATAVGADRSAEMLARARGKPGLAGRLALAGLDRLPFPDGIADVVLCAFALSYAEPLEKAVAELARVAKAGGEVIASDVHPEGYRRGWTRSFRSGSDVYEIEHQSYTVEQLVAAGRAAGLALRELLEARFDEPERVIFCRAGKEALFEAAREIPAVLIARWRRPR